jgi:hypothetical protein
VTIETGDGTLRIADNGIGLTQAQVHELLATIGCGSKRDELGAALRSSGRGVESEAMLRRLLDSLDPDAQSRRYAAYQLAETLDALRRGRKAEALRQRERIVDS